MCKELWLMSYEMAKEDIAYSLDINMEEAEKILQENIEKNANFLDGYYAIESEVF